MKRTEVVDCISLGILCNIHSSLLKHFTLEFSLTSVPTNEMMIFNRLGRIRSSCKLLANISPTRIVTKPLSVSALNMEEKKIDVDGVNINYMKVGNGPHHILCTPGALGSIWTDFSLQVKHMNQSKFTIVYWDPPGYGKSRPPKRDFTPGFHHRDAKCALKLMQNLGIEKYSLLGWSNGGIISLIMAATSPKNIIKLVLWGSNSYFILPIERMGYEAFRDHSMLSPKLKQPYIDLYGQELYDELWDGWISGSIAIMDGEQKGDICKTLLPKISCPTFILHGRKDKNIHPDHPEYLIRNIKNSRLHVFEEGRHNIHMQYCPEFTKLVETFLEDTSKL